MNCKVLHNKHLTQLASNAKMDLFGEIVLLFIVSLFFTAPLPAQNRTIAPTETSHRPDSTGSLLTGQREMQTFNFEEKRVNYGHIPMYWNQVFPRDGFPQYSEGKFDSRFARSGQNSFLLIPDGGSIAFEYDRTRIPVSPGSDFQITGYVHLENALNCRARITCLLTDRRGKTIIDSEHLSRLVGPGDLGPDGWTRLEVYVPGNFPDAQYLTIGLWLLQEEIWNQDTFINSSIFRRDVKALVWFDDITVFQLPRVILQTDKPGNIFTSGETPYLQVEVAGVTTLEYQLKLTVHNTDQQLMHDENWILTGIEGENKVRKIALPKLPAGIYHARLSIISADTLVATRDLTLAHLAPLSSEALISGSNFGILALDENLGDWDTVFTLANLCDAKLIKLPVWRRQSQQGDAIFTEADFDQKLLRLQKNNIGVIATFSEIPDSLAHTLNSGQRTLLDLLSQAPKVWRPHITSVLAQYARQILYWQVGADSMNQNLIWDPRILTAISSLRAEFTTVAGSAILAAPLSGLFQVQQTQIGTSHIALGIPYAIAPHYIPEYVADAHQRGLKNIWATIEPLPEQDYSRQYRLIDFAKRITYAKKGQVESIFIDHPWTRNQYHARYVIEPTEVMLVYRTLADYLGGTNYLGEFNLAPDMPAMIFDRNGVGCLVAWNNRYNPNDQATQKEIRLYLGDNPVKVDLFGNRTVLPTKNGQTRLKLTNWPVLLTGINTRLAALRDSLEIDPPIINASIFRQEVTLKFVNTFSMPISGRFRFLLNQPKYHNWLVEPAARNFTLAPGETFQQPLILKLPRNQIGGKKRLDTYITLDADRPYKIYDDIPFEIQLSGIEMNIFARRLNATDLIVQQVVTNTSDKEISLQSFVDLPDNERLERAVPKLAPGVTVTKTFHITNATQWLGQSIRIGLYDPKGTKRINHNLEIN